MALEPGAAPRGSTGRGGSRRPDRGSSIGRNGDFALVADQLPPPKKCLFESLRSFPSNVERILKRVFYLKNEKEISKESLIKKKFFFGKSNRSSDYAQALMEIGALICKPANPLCFECPISKNCRSFKKNDFEITSKNKFNKIKYFEANIYQNQNKYLLIKNSKFKFLNNLLIFPMKEVEKNKFNISLNKKINIKMSNMDMKIILNKKNKLIKIKNSYLVDKKNIKDLILPSFTKKIFNSVSNYL